MIKILETSGGLLLYTDKKYLKLIIKEIKQKLKEETK